MEKKENSISSNNKEDNNKSNNQINNSLNINQNENDITNIIKDMNFETLSEYYDIESNLFIKRIEKLNLKFYWTSEYLLKKGEPNVHKL